MVAGLGQAGYRLFAPEAAVETWACAARAATLRQLQDPDVHAAQLRHGKTWFVGVDALPNAVDGSVAGAPLAGAWQDSVPAPKLWHAGQVSVLYPGYPRRDADETAANHRYRITRSAAHVDGLLPVGLERRRFCQEPHSFIVGLQLNDAPQAPLVVWPGSHEVMKAAFVQAIGQGALADTDITDVYTQARRRVFDTIAPVAVQMKPGQAVVLHRHLLHGVAPWDADAAPQDVALPDLPAPDPATGRMVAYFRPQYTDDPDLWLTAP